MRHADAKRPLHKTKFGHPPRWDSPPYEFHALPMGASQDHTTNRHGQASATTCPDAQAGR